MSREVLGVGAQETVDAPSDPGADVRLDEPDLSSPVVDRSPLMVSARSTLRRGGPGREVGLRAAAVGAAVLVAGLVGAGAAVQVQRAGDDRSSAVVAWLAHDDGGWSEGAARVGTQLNVVNTGDHEITVTAVDFGGGPGAGGDAGVSGRLAEPVTVAPGAHALQGVLAEVEDCSRSWSAGGGAPDGTLRVSVTGADSRSAWVDGTTVGGYPISASTIREMACWTGYPTPVTVEQTSVQPDGRLAFRLRSTGEDDVEVEVRGPDEVRFVGDRPGPVTVPGGESVTVAVGLQVDSCTDEVRRLDVVDRVRLLVGDEELVDFDYLVVGSWMVREVTRACG